MPGLEHLFSSDIIHANNFYALYRRTNTVLCVKMIWFQYEFIIFYSLLLLLYFTRFVWLRRDGTKPPATTGT